MPPKWLTTVVVGWVVLSLALILALRLLLR